MTAYDIIEEIDDDIDDEIVMVTVSLRLSLGRY